MTDDERIEMYFKFGFLDWKNEQQESKTILCQIPCRLTAKVEKLITVAFKNYL